MGDTLASNEGSQGPPHGDYDEISDSSSDAALDAAYDNDFEDAGYPECALNPLPYYV